ncbi:MAG: FAD-dependent oxidoreductase [Chloroflexi bacterium]|nr:FAD-dependent oxidoreductase [Chloroflexota bacterium]MCL5026004.1 FAD-dependent oxidoreductase [Chloroflexota bacterium]
MSVEVKQPYDVVVAGGGTAGVVAGIAAARTGARTLLIEQNGYVGGVAALGNLPFLGFHNNRNEQIIKGIGWEIVSRLLDVDAAVITENVGIGEPRGKGSPKFNGGGIFFRPEAYKYVALDMLSEAGCELMLHTYISDVVMDGNTLAGLVVENKSGRAITPARRVVDCTGDGDVAARAGAPFEKGRPGDRLTQPVTPLFVLSNVDLDRAIAAGATYSWMWEPVGPKAEHWRGRFRWVAVKLERWERELREEFPGISSGLFEFLLVDINDGVFYCGNMIHLAKLDGSDADQLSQAEQIARSTVWRLGGFLRRHVPGFERAHVVSTPAIIGVRETRRILGDYYLTYDDAIEARRFDDAVTQCGYRVDVHGYDGGKVYYEPERGTQVKDYGSYDIPYRSLLPRKVDNLLMAGRCISGSHEAQGSYRVMGPAMGMGHAAGTAAAMSVREGVSPREMDARKLQETLLEQGALVRLPPREVEAAPTAL